jgi:hydrogenase maturation protease
VVVPALAHLMPGLAVIGCGNSNRGDDGVGPRVIELLRGRPVPEDVALYDAGTNGLGVMYLARGADRLIIVDARAPEDAPGACPGAIFEVPGDELAAEPPAGLNLHEFRWDHALYAGRRIYGDDFPPSVTVLLVEAESIGLRVGLSAPVEAAAAAVADRIVTLAGGEAP